MTPSSRVRLALWLPVFVAALAGGWVTGGLAVPDREARREGQRGQPAAGGKVEAAVQPRGELARGVEAWMQRVKAAGAGDFPGLYAELETLFPAGAERRDAARGFLFAAWLEKDEAGARAFAGQQEDEGALLETVLQVMVRVRPERAAELVLGRGEGDLPEKVKERGQRDLATCYPALYLKLDATGESKGWEVALKTLAKQDAVAAAVAWSGSRNNVDVRCSQCAAVVWEWEKQDRAGARRWAESLTDSVERAAAVNAWLKALAAEDPRAALSELAGCNVVVRDAGGIESGVRQQIAERLAKVDFAAAMAVVRETADPFAEIQKAVMESKAEALPREPAALLAELDAMARVIDPGYAGGKYPGAMDYAFFGRVTWHTDLSPQDSLTAARLRMQSGLKGEDDFLLSNLLYRAGHEQPEAAVALLLEVPDSMKNGMALNMIAGGIDPGRTEQVSTLLRQLEPASWAPEVIQLLEDHLPEYAPIAAVLPAGEEGDAARAEYARCWVRKDPAAAAAWVRSSPENRVAVAALTAEWAGYDERAAAAWTGGLPRGAVRDGAVEGLVREFSWSDPDAAWRWAAPVADRELRVDLLTQLAKAWENPPEAFREACAAEGITAEAEPRLNREKGNDPFAAP